MFLATRTLFAVPEIIDHDITIAPSETRNVDYDITSSINIVNHGTLSGIIEATSAVEFSVRNDGDLSAVFNLSPIASLRQIVSSSAELQPLNVLGGTYNPIIENSFSDVWVIKQFVCF